MGPSSFTLVVADLPPAADLVDAVVARCNALLVAAGTLRWFGTGEAPPGQALPYAQLVGLDEEAEYQEDGSGRAPYDDSGDLQVNAYAATAEGCKAAARSIERALRDAPLTFADGQLLYLRRRSRSAIPALDPDPAPGGGDCWSTAIFFASIVARNL